MKSKTLKISDVTLLVNRGVTPKYSSEGNTRLIKSAHVYPTKIKWGSSPYITEPNSNYLNYMLQEGDILLNGTGTGTVGRAGIVDDIPYENFIPDSHINLIRVDKKIINPWYLFYWLNSPYGQRNLSKFITGSTNQVELSPKKVAQLEFPYVSINDQNHLVESLQTLNRIIGNRSKALSILDEILHSIFLEMFGKILFAEISDEVELRKYIKVIGGYAFKSTDFSKDGIPVIKIGTVNKGYFDLRSCSFIPIHIIKSINADKYRIYPNDLLISLTGTVGKEDYGNVCIATAEHEFYLLNQRVAKIEYDKSSFTPEFLFYFFKNNKIKSQLTKISRGVRQANISNEDILKIKLSIPSIKLQIKFSETVYKTELLKQKMLIQSQELDTQFQALMQKSFQSNANF